MAKRQQQNSDHYEEIDLFDYLSVIFKHRRMIVRNSAIAAFFALIIGLLLPKTYTATTTLLPPDDSDSGGISSLLATSSVPFLNLTDLTTTSSEIFVEILKSRTVADGVLKRKYRFKNGEYNLFEIWKDDSPEKAIRELHKKSNISSNEQGIIQIQVEMRDPSLAAQVANAFAIELHHVNQEKSLSKAKNSRLYIDEQLKITEENLKKASEALAEFQTKSKTINLEEQTKVAIAKAGEIKGTIMAREVELQVALQTMKGDNPIILRLQKEVDELKKQFEHLQFGNSVPFEEQKDYFIPFTEVPEVGRNYAKHIREVKVQETVWQLLNQQYYSAKIQEARDTPTVQVLDKAVPPEKRSKPKRKFLVLVTTVLTFMFSIVWAFVLNFGEQVKQKQEFNKISKVITDLKQDYSDIKVTTLKLLTKFKNLTK